MSAFVVVLFIIQLLLSEQWDSIESDNYYPHGTYIILKKPEGFREIIESIMTLEYFSKCQLTTDGIIYSLSPKTKSIKQREHTFNPKLKYIKTVYHVPYNMGNYNYFTNNCKQFYYDHKGKI